MNRVFPTTVTVFRIKCLEPPKNRHLQKNLLPGTGGMTTMYGLLSPSSKQQKWVCPDKGIRVSTPQMAVALLVLQPTASESQDILKPGGRQPP